MFKHTEQMQVFWQTTLGQNYFHFTPQNIYISLVPLSYTLDIFICYSGDEYKRLFPAKWVFSCLLFTKEITNI